MKRSVGLPLMLTATAFLAPHATANAELSMEPEHFRLIDPVSWLVTNERGDPQKAGPCGGSNTDWGTPSWVVSEYVGGSMLHLELVETIYHPGHYRVALARQINLLPPQYAERYALGRLKRRLARSGPDPASRSAASA